MCLACQHFDFNSADWISDNLHVISSRYYFANNGKGIYLSVQRNEPLRTSAWEASFGGKPVFSKYFQLPVFA